MIAGVCVYTVFPGDDNMSVFIQCFLVIIAGMCVHTVFPGDECRCFLVVIAGLCVHTVFPGDDSGSVCACSASW